MTDRIDGNQSAYIPPTESTDDAESTDECTDAAASDSTGAPSDVASATSIGEEDVWEKAPQSSEGEVHERGQSGHEPSPAAGNIDPDQAMAAWEFAAGFDPDDIDVEQDAGMDANAGPGDEEEAFSMEDNSVAAGLSRALSEIDEHDVRSGELGMHLNAHVFDKLRAGGRQELVALANNTDALHDHLVRQSGDVEMADDFVEVVHDRVVGIAGEQIAQRAREPIESGMELIDGIDESTESRRGFLGGIVQGADSRQNIEDGLRDIGLSASSADDLAEELEMLRTDDVALQEFLDGAEGEAGFFGFGAGEYDSIEDELHGELDSMRQGLESLESGLMRDQIQHDRILTNSVLEPIRDEVFEDMGAELGADGQANELGEVFNDRIDDSRSAQAWERGAQFFVGLGAGAAATVGTGGVGSGVMAGVGASMAAAQTVPDIAQAGQDVDIAQGAVAADLDDPQLVDMAERDEKVAYAIALGSTIGGGAGGAVDTPLVSEGVDTILEAGNAVIGGDESGR